jgi:hypothetical protein
MKRAAGTKRGSSLESPKRRAATYTSVVTKR